MAHEGVQRPAGVAVVPEGHGGVGGPRGEQELLHGVERHRIDLLAVRREGAHAGGLPYVVEENARVVAAGGQQVAVEGVPGDVLRVIPAGTPTSTTSFCSQYVRMGVQEAADDAHTSHTHTRASSLPEASSPLRRGDQLRP